MSRFLVTGGAGFIGSNIVDYLVMEGHEVNVLDNLTTGSTSNLDQNKNNIKFIEGDVRNRQDIDRAVDDCEYVLHHAAISLVGPTIEDPLLAHQVNVSGTLNVLQSCREASVKRVVQASSAAIYGNSQGVIRVETDQIVPLTPYSATKAAAEYYARVYEKLYGVETVSLRYFNVYGPRQDSQTKHAGALAVFVRNLLTGELPVVHGDGEQSRDFVYVGDVCKANLKAALGDYKDMSDKSYNIGSGIATTIYELLRIIREATGNSGDFGGADGRQGDVRHSRADVSLAAKELNWKPETDLRSGIDKFIKWYESEYKVVERKKA